MKKRFMGGILALAMAFSAAPAMAADINITINGEEFVAKDADEDVVEPFIENGSTYLPVRAMGEAVGMTVEFDPENYAVYIGEKPSEEAVKSYARIQVGDRIFYDDDMTVLSAMLGWDAGAGNCVQFYLWEKMAESRFDKSEIEKEKELIKQGFGDIGKEAEMLGVSIESIDRYIYTLACVKTLLDSVEIPEVKYGECVTVKHILVDTKETADEVLKKLNEGTDFGALIEKYDTDPGQTAESSYTFTKGKMVKEFEDAAFKLKEGEMTTEPVKSDYGYHIIMRLPLDREAAKGEFREYYNEALDDEEEEYYEKYSEELKAVVLEHSGDPYGEIDGRKVHKAALDIISEKFNIGDFIDYDTAFSRCIGITGLYKYLTENGLLSETEIDAVRSAEDTVDSNIEAYFNFGNLVDSKLENKELDMNEVVLVLMDSKKTVDAKIYEDVRVFVNGKQIIPTDADGDYVAPKNVTGTVYVPVRAIAESLGMSAEWDNDTRTVVITK